MRKLLYHILFFCLLMTWGCGIDPNQPLQVTGSLVFGHYKISPPAGYWYFPREFPEKLDTDEIFLITFFSEYEDAISKIPPHMPLKALFNFAVSIKKYNDFDSYYKTAKSHGIIYKQLPEEAKTLENIPGWSCKYLYLGLHSLECIVLRDNHIGIVAFGFDQKEVLAEAPVLKKMVESFK